MVDYQKADEELPLAEMNHKNRRTLADGIRFFFIKEKKKVLLFIDLNIFIFKICLEDFFEKVDTSFHIFLF